MAAENHQRRDDNHKAPRLSELDPPPETTPAHIELSNPQTVAVDERPPISGEEVVVEPVPPEPAAIPEPKPEWLVLDPEDHSDPVAHEVTGFDKNLPNSWKLVAASIRGKAHAHKAKWRDDAFGLGWVDEWAILAVADGAGSARLSRVGARIACDEAVATLKDLLFHFHLKKSRTKSPEPSDLQRLGTFLVQASRMARNGIRREAGIRECSENDLHTTLLLAIHGPWKRGSLVGALQIGDGAIALYTGHSTCTILGEADHGEYAGESLFLTSSFIDYESRVNLTVTEDLRCLAVMCDGVADDFYPPHRKLIHLFNGDPIDNMKSKDGGIVRGIVHEALMDPQPAPSLLNWLHYEKRGSFDDRTLALLYRSDLP